MNRSRFASFDTYDHGCCRNLTRRVFTEQTALISKLVVPTELREQRHTCTEYAVVECTQNKSEQGGISLSFGLKLAINQDISIVTSSFDLDTGVDGKRRSRLKSDKPEIARARRQELSEIRSRSDHCQVPLDGDKKQLLPQSGKRHLLHN